MAYQTREFTTAGDDPEAMVEVTFEDGSPKKVFTAEKFAELEKQGEGALKAYEQPEQADVGALDAAMEADRNRGAGDRPD